MAFFFHFVDARAAFHNSLMIILIVYAIDEWRIRRPLLYTAISEATGIAVTICGKSSLLFKALSD